ncbi:MAG: hypothetical protein ABIS69_11710 [Sediminibacterium sp.]
MTTAKKHIAHFITLLVALQLLNLSIYAQDFKPITGSEEDINITESVTEYVVEIVLGHKNAIPEQSQHHKDLHFHKHIAFKAVSVFPSYHLPGMQQQNAASAFPLQESYSYLYYQEINPPPPKA